MVTIGLPFERVKIIKRIRSKEFRRIEGIKFCKDCGSMCKKEIVICVCGSNLFLNGNTAEMLGGYIELSKSGLLRSYFMKKQGKGGIGGMNQKRMVVWLMVHHDRIVEWNNDDLIKIIYKAVKKNHI